MSANASTSISTALIAPAPASALVAPTMLLASQDPTRGTSSQSEVTGVSEAVVQQPDGKILVAGVNHGGFEIARYNSDGTLDTTFGTDGVTGFGNLNLQQVQQIKLQSDGSFYVLGEAPVSGTSSGQIPDAGGGEWWLSPPEITTLIHVEADGSVDTSYGNGGLLSLNNPIILPSATIQNDGKIVVASEAVTGAMSVVRYDADGTLDTSFHFDQSGLPFVGLDAGGPIMVDAQGRIVLTGESADGLHLMRLNSDGSVDTTFGTSGDLTVSLDPGWIGQVALAQQPDGKILLATTTVDQSSGFESYELTRLNTDGSVDTSFNGTGIATEDISPNIGGTSPTTAPSTQIGGIVVQSDGKIIVTAEVLSPSNSTGGSGAGVESGLSAARFNADGSLDTSYGNGGLVNDPSVIGDEFAATLESDGSLLVVGSSPSNPGSSAPATFDVVHLTSDGSLDTTFGDPSAPVNDSPIVAAPIAVQAPVTTSPAPSNGNPSDPSQVSAVSQPVDTTPGVTTPVIMTPVIMTSQVVTLNAAVITTVTNPPASTPATSAQQPATPTTGGGSYGNYQSSAAADSQTTGTTESNIIAIEAAFDLVHSLAND